MYNPATCLDAFYRGNIPNTSLPANTRTLLPINALDGNSFNYIPAPAIFDTTTYKFIPSQSDSQRYFYNLRVAFFIQPSGSMPAIPILSNLLDLYTVTVKFDASGTTTPENIFEETKFIGFTSGGSNMYRIVSSFPLHAQNTSLLANGGRFFVTTTKSSILTNSSLYIQRFMRQ